MSNDDKNRSAAKEIAKRVQERRLDKQYQIMLDWRNGLDGITGLEAINKIVELERLIEVVATDFNKSPPTPGGKTNG